MPEGAATGADLDARDRGRRWRGTALRLGAATRDAGRRRSSRSPSSTAPGRAARSADRPAALAGLLGDPATATTDADDGPASSRSRSPTSAAAGRTAPTRTPHRLASGPADLRDRERVRRHLHRSAGSAGCRPTRSRATCSAGSSSWGRSSNVFLRNGARLYLDVGSHPEYATPECDDIIDLVTHDKAGERILEGLLVDAEKRLREDGIAGDIYLFKNNTDSAGQLLRLPRELPGRPATGVLQARRGADPVPRHPPDHLRRRQGAADPARRRLLPSASGPSTSGRASRSATTRSRPIINTRDEPHADAERYRRLHVIVGDSNMSETTTMLKVGATDLVLRMIEARRRRCAT